MVLAPGCTRTDGRSEAHRPEINSRSYSGLTSHERGGATPQGKGIFHTCYWTVCVEKEAARPS